MSGAAFRRLSWLLLSLSLRLATADISTTVVAVTSTTTVHVTATDYDGACENFVGACVVYGSPYGSAPYTTTVYASQQSNMVTTSTTTVVATTTASNSDACSGFVGACVVYATGSGSAPASTVYYGGDNDPARPGNDQGYIGPGTDGGDGYIGAAPSHPDPLSLTLAWSLISTLGALVWI